MKLVKSISRGLALLERATVVLVLGTMITLAFLQVILRNVFATGILWADPFLRHLVLWVGFLGASLATMEEKHINLDILNRLASPRIVNLARIVTNGFAALVTALLTQAGMVFLGNEIDSGEILLRIGQTALPAWWFQGIIPIGFGLMMFRFLIRMVEHIGEAIHPPSATPAGSANVSAPTS